MIEIFKNIPSLTSTGRLFVFEEKSAGFGGKFVIHHLIKHLCDASTESNTRIILILTDETLASWETTATKLGLNLPKLIEHDKISVIDLCTSAFSSLKEVQPQTETFLQSSHLNLDNLLEACRTRINNSPPNTDGTSLIIIESLSSIRSLVGPSSSHVHDQETVFFLNQLMSLASPNNVGTSVAGCISATGSSFSNIVSKVLATDKIQVRPLKTGYSPLFHGYLTVTTSSDHEDVPDRSLSYYQFKVDSKSVQLTTVSKKDCGL